MLSRTVNVFYNWFDQLCQILWYGFEMNWNKLSTPKPPTLEEAQSIARLQFDWYMGFMSDYSFICAMNIMFDCINLDELNETNKTIDRRKW